jgi:hypothetical protein
MINDVGMLKIYVTPCGNDPILYSRVNSFMRCKNLTSLTKKYYEWNPRTRRIKLQNIELQQESNLTSTNLPS